MLSHPDIPVLYQDDDIVVINKPAGLPVHAGSGGGITLEDYLHKFQYDKKEPPQLAHRLDRDTSGCLILGRHKQALRHLGRMFETRRIRKTYWAVVHGAFPVKQMRVDMPLAKINDRKNKWHMRPVPVEQGGQPAVTDIRLLKKDAGKSLLSLHPHTGRTHQLRVHCAARNHPIIGDRFYGPAHDENAQLLLHARSLVIPNMHPGQPEPIHVEAPLPDYMEQIIASISDGAAQ